MNKTKPLWLDLELREDVDDFFTLIYALENAFPVHVLSIHNPSINELKLIRYVLSMFSVDIPVVVTGAITEYEKKKDLSDFTLNLAKDFEPVHYTLLPDFLFTFATKEIDFTVFCGGSLTTLAYLVENIDNSTFDAYIQGGFASYEFVGTENTLKKFKKRKSVPSWNMNLDFDATKIVLASSITKHFISKNICHDSFVHKDHVNGVPTLFGELLFDFLDNNFKPDKCMHDLLAFFSVFDELITFAPVDLCFDDSDERIKWFSIINEGANTYISTRYNKTRYFELIKNNP